MPTPCPSARHFACLRLANPLWIALSCVTGVALQLQQSQLSPAWVYGVVACLACAGLGVARWCAVRGMPAARWLRDKGASRDCATFLSRRVLVMAGVGWCLAWLGMAWAWAGWLALGQHAQQLAAHVEGQDVRLHAVVDAMPLRTAQGWRVRWRVEQAWQGEQPVALPERVEVVWYRPRPQGRDSERRNEESNDAGNEGHRPESSEGRSLGQPLAETAVNQPEQAGTTVWPAPVQAGERWALTVRLKAPHGARNPHGWDWELWLWEQGVGATGYVREAPGVQAPQRLPASGWLRPMQAARQQVRDAIWTQAVQAGHASAARVRAWGVVAALVTGDQRSIDALDWDVFRRTGTAHLVSLSGLHITMFAWLATALVGGLWRTGARCGLRGCWRWPAPTVALWAGVLLAAGYAWFSGWGLPAQRTVWMLGVVAALRSGGWQWPWYVVWAVALAVIALADPWALCQAGFWLSFVAVGVLLAQGAARATQAEPRGGRAVSLWRRGLLALQRLLREQLVVVAALSPLTLLFFGQISVVGLLANALAIPWVTLLLTPVALLGVLWSGGWACAAWMVAAMVWVLEAMARWPGASVLRAQAPWWLVGAAIAGGVWMAWRVPWHWRLLDLPVLWPALWWQMPRPAPGDVQMLALDVGQGSAVLLRTARHSLLFDTGPGWMGGDAGARVVQPLLQAWGESLDMVVLSHGDMDHTGGADSIHAAHPVARWMGDGVRVWQDKARGAVREAELPGSVIVSGQPCVAGMQWEWDGVLWQVLHPGAEHAVQAQESRPMARRQSAQDMSAGGQRPASSNSRSCVLRVQAANGAAVLLPGDIEAAQEAHLLRSAANVRADVLLAPHHGSRTSSSAVWLQAVAPRTVVVQAGYRNRFGHPAKAVVQRYRDVGAQVVATPQCGAVHWHSQAPAEVECERERSPRYWSSSLRVAAPPAAGP